MSDTQVGYNMSLEVPRRNRRVAPAAAAPVVSVAAPDSTPEQPTKYKSMGAYAQGLPCMNPSCKSHGKPHPNCRCWGGFANGGKVSGRFCDSDRAHKPGCEYFSGGGDVPPMSELEELPDTSTPPMSELQEVQDSGSTSQQALAGLEGVAKGFTGVASPAVSWAENAVSGVVPEFSYENQASRQAANPDTYGVGQVAGFGLAQTNPISKALTLGGAGEAAAGLGVLASRVFGGMVQGAGLAAADEVTKAMAGQGDPQAPVASAIIHIGVGGLLGGMSGGAFHATGSVLDSTAEAIENKLGDSLQNFAVGFGGGLKGLSGKGSDSFFQGMQAGNWAQKELIKRGFQAVGMGMFGPKGIVAGSFLNTALGGVVKPYFQKSIGKLGPIAIMKAISAGNALKLGTLNYANVVDSGAQALTSAVNTVISGGSQAIGNGYATDVYRAKLMENIEGGSLQDEMINTQGELNQPTQGYAEGGVVQSPVTTQTLANPNGLEQIYPEQNSLLHAAKSRTFSYLNSLRPQTNLPHAAYDEPPDQTEQHRSYKDACDIALDPLSIMNKVRDGSLDPEHVQHLNSLYPEVSQQINQKVMDRINMSKIKKEPPPPYRVRQALSLLLGTPLDSSLAPQNVAAAQAAFLPPQQQQPPPPPVAKKQKPSALADVVDDYRTSTEAAALRAQGGK